MRRISRTLLLSFIGALVLVPASFLRFVHAQTPAQMEYERQQREYRQAQERQREEQQRMQRLQQDNARRQQEETNRAARQAAPGPQSPQYPSTQGSSPSASPGAGSGGSTAQNICKKKPIRAGERNSLLGQWRFAGAQAASGNPMEQMLQAFGALACPTDGFEFRERAMLSGGKVLPAHYGRDGDVWMACVVDSSLRFRAEGPNRLHMVEPACTFERVSASHSTTAR